MTFRDKEIRENIEEEKRLPPTHRRGFHGDRDDVAEGADGKPIHVPSPETPEDSFGDKR